MNETLKAQARYSGYRDRIVVDCCPYCGGTHYHGATGDDQGQSREADCFRGEYKLDFTPLQVKGESE
jgi:hypothetical protein